MGEADAIQKTPAPRTRAGLAADLRAVGVRAGMTLLVHSSLQALGYVAGGPVAVLLALQDVLTPAGTLVMPTHTSDYGDPAGWESPPVPADWVATIRAERPLFDPARTPTREMGAIPELFRTWPDVRRSRHPLVSFAAWGAAAEAVTADHSLANGMGDGSPLARVYERDGYVLLLGVGHDRNTSLHLAEYRSGVRPAASEHFSQLVAGKRRWVAVDDIAVKTDWLPYVGAAIDAAGLVTRGEVGSARSRFMSQRRAVDFAERWLTERAAAGQLTFDE